MFVMHCGDNLPILREMADNSVDAIVTDPPAGIGFMQRDWDSDKGGRDKWIEWMAGIAAECLRVIKPGGHALVWALPRTSHWTATAWENAGWEPRDRICHIFGSGFPKSANISKMIDKAAGAEREVVGKYARPDGSAPRSGCVLPKFNGMYNNGKPGLDANDSDITAPATDAAKQWDGWGTALKPAVEDYWLFRKPLAERTIAANVLEWGTGGVNVDGCRVGTEAIAQHRKPQKAWREREGRSDIPASADYSVTINSGRFPANLIHDGSDEVVRLFPVTTSGNLKGQPRGENKIYGSASATLGKPRYWNGDTGSAARFFYCAKASRSEREAGLEGDKCTHPTVKPIALMRYLCRLVTPPGGIVLDPFTGSGTTGCAATLEGFGFVGIEREAEYAEIARRRIEHWKASLGNIKVEDDSQGQLFEEVE